VLGDLRRPRCHAPAIRGSPSRRRTSAAFQIPDAVAKLTMTTGSGYPAHQPLLSAAAAVRSYLMARYRNPSRSDHLPRSSWGRISTRHAGRAPSSEIPPSRLADSVKPLFPARTPSRCPGNPVRRGGRGDFWLGQWYGGWPGACVALRDSGS